MPSAHPYDLHTHSYMSDGAETPSEVVRAASEAGMALFALTDHDSVDGLDEAFTEAERVGLRIISGLEFNTQFGEELHILGLGLDYTDKRLTAALAAAQAHRRTRRDEMVRRLGAAGMDIADAIRTGPNDNVTRYNVALALTERGYVQSAHEAFERFLSPESPFYVRLEKPLPEEVIDLIHKCGGVAVLAHPCKMNADPHALVDMLAGLGLDGIEAFYPTSSPGQTELFVSLAHCRRLLVTCGSDYHGVGRRSRTIGCAWNESADLENTFEFLMCI